MHRSFLAFATLLPLLLPSAPAQEIPGIRTTLSTRSFVPVNDNIVLRFVIQADTDAEIPGDWLTGVRLQIKADDQPVRPLVQAGKGGTVAIAAGTRIERLLTFPAQAFVSSPELDRVAIVTAGWEGLAGTNCVFKIAPDTRNVDLATLDLQKTQVVLVTNFGEMRLSFRPDKAKQHVENFVKLCLSGFYDGTKFHRVIRDFMIQGGCPNTKDDAKQEQWGSGGPGYKINAEFNDLRHLRGTLSMARTTDPNSAGSGFFIVHKDAPNLDGQYTAFGNLEEGADTLDRIAYTSVAGPKRETPVQPVILHAAVVLPVKK